MVIQNIGVKMKIKNKNKVFLTVLALLALGTSNNAHAVAVSFVGAGTYSKQTYDATQTAAYTDAAKLGFGGGLLFDFPLAGRLGLQIGGLYITRKSELTYTTAGAAALPAGTSSAA